MDDHLARVAEAPQVDSQAMQADELTCDDIERLQFALSCIGYAHQGAERWHSMVRDLIRGTIDRHRRLGAERDEIATLRGQNTALVAALEHMVNDCESLEFDGAPSSAALNKAVYALASVKGGAA
ncbi:hypothetical protein DFO50_109119 [Microvirgula sp. AG722]|uniref:hypothetical protein n=1 Tax=Microvirgula sp. AG722 TaxID=2183901 RepID=UPI000DC40B7B|nr:hypothetical protein [Microvirgula sp. AG722]RAS14864.1 hypothetical protein DFO50_109119 [Microvirgula sp. AG722]